MTDDIDDLRRALKTVPSPDADAKARAVRLAMENFDRLQGSTDAARSSEDRPRAAPLNGVRRMFHYLTSRPALAATTSVAALVIGVAVIFPVTDLRIALPTGPATETPKPEVAGDVARATKGEGATTATALPGSLDTSPQPKQRTEATDELLGQTAPAVSVAEQEPVAEPGPAPADPTPPAAEPMEETIAEGFAATREIISPDFSDSAAAAAPAEGGGVALSEGARNGLLKDNESDKFTSRARVDLQTSGDNDGTLAYSLPQSEIAPILDSATAPVENTEAYSNEAPNPVKVTAEEPVSTFSIDVDTASYAVVRSSLASGHLPTPDQVRIEEMVNYFPYAYPAPTPEAAFSTSVAVMQTPWNPGTRLVSIGIQGAVPAITDRPPLNLVFLIDTSGSMEGPDRLGLLRQSLVLMLPELRPEDQVAIVTYAGSAGLVLPPTAAADRAAILTALENLSAGGSTAGAEGLELAYRVAEGMATDGEVSRILLATDGDFNVGVSDPDGLESYVGKKRDTGTYLSILGFGRGNLDDAVMQSLAQNGNGQAAYIDTLSEARKVLVDQLTGALFPIADDVKIQVEWNPAQVAEYRLVGYETRALRREDFNNDKVDAGEIGAGTQVTAIYEITAPGSDALRNDPLRYGTATPATGPDELGTLKLRWKAPGEAVSTLMDTAITGTEPASDDTRFAAAIAGFGQALQGSVYLGEWGLGEAIDLALGARGDDPYGYRIEAVNLMRLAQSLSD